MTSKKYIKLFIAFLLLLLIFGITISIIGLYLKTITQNCLNELYDNYGKIETDYVDRSYWDVYYCRCDENTIKENNYSEQYIIKLKKAKPLMLGFGGFIVFGEQSYRVYDSNGDIVSEFTVENQPLYFEWHLRSFKWELHYV